MKNNKTSINFKVLIGYLILVLIAGGSVWFVYNRIIQVTQSKEIRDLGNEKLFLMTEAMTNLYNAESLSREIIQNQNQEDLERFEKQIDYTKILLDSLQAGSFETEVGKQLDSIDNLLTRKEGNLKEFLKIRIKNNSRNYYDRVLKRLEEFNYMFEEDNFSQVVKGLDSVQKRAILGWLKYSKKDNAKRLTQQSADSLVQAMKTVLISMEREEYRYQKSIEAKEDELLKNDRQLSQQLRGLRAEIEQEAINGSIERVNKSKKLLADTSNTILWLGLGSVLIILIFIFLILKDTKKSRRYRRQIEDAKLFAESLLTRQEQFMAAITHDLRSPLNTVMGYSNLLEESQLSKSQSHYLGQLKKSSAYILHLVNDLLDYSKLESGNVKVEELPFNPKNLIDDSIAASIPLEPDKKVLIKKHIDKELNAYYLSDPFRIQQILSNLLSNAYKFTDEGTIDISGAIKVDALWYRELVIKVKDSGIGIEKDKQDQIFNEFSQADSSIEKRYGGSGLGLAITKQLVELLNGKIQLESELKKGTVFTVSIPIQKTSKESVKAEKTAHLIKPADKQILIVDDDLTQLDLSFNVLSKAGFLCQTAKNGEEALSLVENNQFDLIITDIQMPAMNGFELLKNLKQNKASENIPVIALSGRTDILKGEFLKKGFKTNLTKPFQPANLLKAIGKILDLKKMEFEDESQNNANALNTDNEKIYDLSQLKQFTGNDKDSLNSVLESFLESTKLNLEQLAKAVKNNDKDQVAFYTHKLLPMLKQINAEKVVQPIEDLERISQKEMSSSEIEETFEQVKPDLKELLRKIENEVKEDEA